MEYWTSLYVLKKQRHLGERRPGSITWPWTGRT